MRILLLTTYLAQGGASIATHRLYESLKLCHDIEVRLIALFGQREGEHMEDANILILSERSKTSELRAYGAKALERLCLLPKTSLKRDKLWRFSSAAFGQDLSEHPWLTWAEVIHLHWINHGLLSLKDLRQLSKLGKPIVWTLHDLWALTGGCHIPYIFRQEAAELCPRLAVGCGACPLLEAKASTQDFTRKLLEQKQFLREAPFHYISVSKHVAQLIAQVCNTESEVIPPALHSFSLKEEKDIPLPKALPQENNPLFLCLVAARLSEPVKGGSLLLRLAELLAKQLPEELKARIHFLLVGAHEDDFATLPLPRTCFPQLSTEQVQCLYKASHIVLSTSLFETFGQTLSEALASGTPVVCFDSVGASELISQGKNGAVVPAYDCNAMAQAIMHILRHPEAYTAETCRSSISHLKPDNIAQRHIDLYRSLLQGL